MLFGRRALLDTLSYGGVCGGNYIGRVFGGGTASSGPMLEVIPPTSLSNHLVKGHSYLDEWNDGMMSGGE